MIYAMGKVVYKGFFVETDQATMNRHDVISHAV